VSGLTELADQLIIRHLRVSIPAEDVRLELQKGLRREPLLDQKLRCVALVGAGGSAALFDRGAALAKELEDEFSSPNDKGRRAELFRLQRIYKLDPEDFETRLAALSRTPEVTQHIRQTIAERYGYRHPTILGYELLAHLLKHRFLDAIISFNFDELLDQSLDDELGRDGYRRLVSDRDCADVVKNPDDPGYLPLYIKLHGTASEPDSLRFTQEAYYALPRQMTDVVETLFDSVRCVIVNVGFGMAGLDLHRLLRIPVELKIYDLSPKPLSKDVRHDISSERSKPLDDSLRVGESRQAPSFALLGDQSPPAKGQLVSCDDWMKRLMHEIEQRSGKRAGADRLAALVRFRSVDRHEAIADALGPATNLSSWIKEPDKHRDDYVEYLKQRTIVELALSGTKARGLAQLSWLAIDRCGTYYELYRREAQRVPMPPSTWNVVRSAAGLDENEWLPDVVESQPDLCARKAEPTLDNGKWALREFVPRTLAEHVIERIGNNHPPTKTRLTKALKNLQAGSEVEIQPTDDRVCSKAFDSPLTLPTITSLDIFTKWLFKDLRPADEVYISCETGEWLIQNEKMFELLSKQEHIEVITAFHLKSKGLHAKYGDTLNLRVLNPWRHNRHMTVVCRGDSAMRAVYFARRLRTPLITPVYLDQPNDAARIKHAFDLMRQEIDETISVQGSNPKAA
jgi:hypothetical protein